MIKEDYFTTTKYIFRYIHYGCFIRGVKPHGPIINCGNCYKAHSIELGERMDLFDSFPFLISIGADINIHDIALRHFACKGHFKQIKYLVENGADVTTLNNKPIQLAASYGYLDIVKYFADNGGDITANNHMAFILAVCNGHYDTVKYLVENGADILTKDNYALKLAVDNGHYEIIRFLVENSDMNLSWGSYVKTAAGNGHLHIVEYLVENGANHKGAIKTAIQHKHLNIVKYLIENGHYTTEDKDEAYSLAVETNCLDIVKYLTEKSGF